MVARKNCLVERIFCEVTLTLISTVNLLLRNCYCFRLFFILYIPTNFFFFFYGKELKWLQDRKFKTSFYNSAYQQTNLFKMFFPNSTGTLSWVKQSISHYGERDQMIYTWLENSATTPSAAAMRLEIWHMFNMLVWTYQTLS